MIAFVKEYEKKCIESYLNRIISIKEDINEVIQEANIFLKEKQAYLQRYRIDDEEIKIFNKKSEKIQSALNKKSKKLKCLTFDEKIIKFLSNTNEINKFELGEINYELLIKPLVSNFSIFFFFLKNFV